MAAPNAPASPTYTPEVHPYDTKWHSWYENIPAFCDKVTKRCIEWGFEHPGARDFYHDPLVMCDIILSGLPDTHPWTEVMAEYSDLIVCRGGDIIPNLKKYMRDGQYMMTPAYLRHILELKIGIDDRECASTNVKDKEPMKDQEDSQQGEPMKGRIRRVSSRQQAMVRSPIPAPKDLTREHEPEQVTYQLGGETLQEYVTYMRGLCKAWSQTRKGRVIYRHPLMISHLILRGLPDMRHWRSIKNKYNDLVFVNAWNRTVTNDSKYRHYQYDAYAVDTLSLRMDLEEALMPNTEGYQGMNMEQDEEPSEPMEEEDTDENEWKEDVGENDVNIPEIIIIDSSDDEA